MNKIGRIFLGWWYWATNRNNKLARYRLSVCVRCDLMKWGVCTGCGCPLQAKSRIHDEKCPHPNEDKWKTEVPLSIFVNNEQSFTGSVDIVSGEFKVNE